MPEMTIRQLQLDSHRIAHDHGFWDVFDTVMSSEAACHETGDEETPEIFMYLIDTKLMLCVGELSEAEDALRHKKPMAEFAEELADVMIRVADLAECLDINLTEAILKKQAINEKRPHLHGKRF